MKNVIDELALKEELTPEQWETFKETKEKYGIDVALDTLPEMTDWEKTFEYTMVNRRIKELRLENGLTQTDLANILRVSQKEYWRYEQDGYNMGIGRLASIAVFYNVSIDWISGWLIERKPFYSENERTIYNGYNLQDFKEAKKKGVKYTPLSIREMLGE